MMSKYDVLEMVQKYLNGLYKSHIDGTYTVKACDYLASGYMMAVNSMTKWEYDMDIRKIYGSWLKDNAWDYLRY